MRPLEGVRVVDFTTLLPGPMATLLLAEAGAEVIKVERPGRGEEMRHHAPMWGQDSVNFALLNRGKKSVVVDLKNPDGRARVEPLIAGCDVLIEQFRPGVMDRLGLGYEAVVKLNPSIVYCSISGYGQTGPKRDVAAHDLNYIGDTGLLSLSMGTLDVPVIPPVLIADIAGGAYPAVINILLALRQRDATGQGCRLDIAMTDNLFPLMYSALGERHVRGICPGSGTALTTGGTPRYRLYPTADDRMVAAAPIEQKFWEMFCDIIMLDSDLRNDSLAPATTAAAISRIIRNQSAAYWSEAFAGKDCCCTIVATLEEALADPHFRARSLFAHRLINEQGELQLALPVPIDPAFRAPPGEAQSAPPLGAHNEEIFAKSAG
jgi:crotonobetainyl-CoA:carnitine CoA-transferase CaiB-like acyl-CoA transferase